MSYDTFTAITAIEAKHKAEREEYKSALNDALTKERAYFRGEIESLQTQVHVLRAQRDEANKELSQTLRRCNELEAQRDQANKLRFEAEDARDEARELAEEYLDEAYSLAISGGTVNAWRRNGKPSLPW